MRKWPAGVDYILEQLRKHVQSKKVQKKLTVAPR